ncbi:MAG: GNAT family protein [Pseudomonadota bacterium]
MLPETLQTSRFVLNRFSDADAEDLFRHFSTPTIVEHMDIAPLQTVEQAQEIIDWTKSIYQDKTGIRWIIRTHEESDFVGTCGFNQIVQERASRAEIAYDLWLSYWGKGVLQEVMPAVLEIGFNDLSLRRIEAFVNPGNHRSCRTLERLGFQQEGILRDYAYWLGKYWDQRIFSLLASDWAKRSSQK